VPLDLAELFAVRAQKEAAHRRETRKTIADFVAMATKKQ
jgi:hypothetical protein